jgi:hypothetical protein
MTPYQTAKLKASAGGLAWQPDFPPEAGGAGMAGYERKR